MNHILTKLNQFDTENDIYLFHELNKKVEIE